MRFTVTEDNWTNQNDELVKTSRSPSSATDDGKRRVTEGGRGELDVRYPRLQIHGRGQ
jgi:hypothetical protein